MGKAKDFATMVKEFGKNWKEIKTTAKKKQAIIDKSK